MTVARPVVVACGDILGVAFDGEDEAVLFAPHSGDVLISEVTQWRELISPRASDAVDNAPAAGSAGSDRAAGSDGVLGVAHAASLAGKEAPVSELRATLSQLGVQFG